MAGHVSVLGYFLHAGAVVKSVMFILTLASITSWTLIIERLRYFRQKREETQHFLNRFWRSADLSRLWGDLDGNGEEKTGVSALFYEGFKAYWLRRKQSNIAIDQVERVMQIVHAKEAARLEEHLPLFASIGSISPYIGLFGTVWGIMTSFQALGQAQQATIAMVAPGISEALVATALGLFTAIPAVIAYNRFSTMSNELLEEFDVFQQELTAIMEQPPQVASTEPSPSARAQKQTTQTLVSELQG